MFLSPKRNVLLLSYAIWPEKRKATYQRAITIVSKEMLGDIIENATWTIWSSNTAKNGSFETSRENIRPATQHQLKMNNLNVLLESHLTTS